MYSKNKPLWNTNDYVQKPIVHIKIWCRYLLRDCSNKAALFIQYYIENKLILI